MTTHSTLNPEFTTLTDPILQEGDFGDAVVELQKLLNAKGATLVTDGDFGAKTKAAVIKFQQQNGLVADGIVGPLTWAALRKPATNPIKLVDVCLYYEPNRFPHQTNAINWLQTQLDYPIFREFVQRWDNNNEPGTADFTRQMGDYGAAVYEIQVMLNKTGANLVTDGQFGSNTKAAVIKFQQQNSLVADGVVGLQTWAKLRQTAEPRYLRVMFDAYDATRFPHQTKVLEWLQSKIPGATLTQFTQRWRNEVTTM